MKHRLVALSIGLAAVGSVTAGAAGCATETVAVAQTAVQETATDSSVTLTSIPSSAEGSFLDVTELFTDRDMEQSADIDGATIITVTNETDVVIDEEGVYILSGDASNVTVEVDAGDEARVQLVLDGVSIVNESAPMRKPVWKRSSSPDQT